ncbi:hypothetical protein LQ938_09850 [Microbacterium sp. cx-55]|uniref:hypothetical protein n=1 Tax=Microbacterium sp. cx-55 TaxID=2875948 RepID=UPI001CBE0E6F|nr:hypothetical protein [Microbacterium sp. cx-55]MBZ4485937.1 hypothetical protein [Microbacterium sp. cx-55]UGB34188.1 hypothetical protein LQ938_09850 [Microbacterium sp. cx-55]
MRRSTNAADAIRSASTNIGVPAVNWTTLGVLGTLATNLANSAVQRATLTALADLASRDPAELRAFLDEHPALASQFSKYPPAPESVSEWWASVNDPAAQQALVSAAPVILGSLGGLPPLVRVAGASSRVENQSALRDILLAVKAG